MTVVPQKNAVPVDITAAGVRAVETEKDALGALAQALNGEMAAPFRNAVTAMLEASGRVIISGMGKSGHIARKIAATLASTGTPSHFVHPGEASHGDLGMIAKGDVVVAISNSGETAELGDLIAYTRRFGITLVAITSKPLSTLARAADVPLVLPPCPEACPIGMAPTTSTTLTLALGDALACALLEARGFTKADFGNYHPGGKLGKVLVRVSDLMHTGTTLPLASDTATMQQAILEISSKRLGCVGIVAADGTLAGMITDGDLRRHMTGDIMVQAATTVMTKNPLTITADKLAAEAVALMQEKSITQLFVLDEQRKPVGVIHIHDCLKAGLA